MQIALSSPVKGNWEGRGFGRRYVWTYICKAGHTVKVRCGSWRGFKRTPSGGLVGITPVTGVGAICCPQCDFEEKYSQSA